MGSFVDQEQAVAPRDLLVRKLLRFYQGVSVMESARPRLPPLLGLIKVQEQSLQYLVSYLRLI
ncbi:MAG: hypothetical protein AB1589_10390 [Cyanobacteriota bacterium]